jgi:uncharacterized protein (DUF608 family)
MDSPQTYAIPAAAWRRNFNAPQDPGQKPKLAGQYDGGALHGSPLGGIGAGGINRDWTGAFRRWTLKPGAVKHFTEAANCFAAFQQIEGGAPNVQVLCPRDPTNDPALEA